MRIEIPDFCLVALVGASGSGKSTFAQQHFKPTEVLSSDFFRGLVSDDENDQRATSAAFDCLYQVAEKRLSAGHLTVIDATNVQKGARAPIVRLARAQNCFAVALVLDMAPELCQARNARRPNRDFPAHVVSNHCRELKRSLRYLSDEGFRYVHVLRRPEETEAVEIARVRLWTDKRDESGPFDIIGDVHGCYDELCALLAQMGYAVDPAAVLAVPPGGRRAIFLGDLVDRGPENVKVLRLVMNMVEAGTAFCLTGNHEARLLKKLRGADVKLSYGLDLTVRQLEAESAEFIEKVKTFLDGLISHYVLDEGRLVAAHAGLKENLQGRTSRAVREFCLYGETTGETDEYGLPVRLNWAEEYRGRALVLYGHIPSLEVRNLNNTICLDTGCVFGGALTAFRYPERELAAAPAARVHYEPVKPLAGQADEQNLVLNIRDVLGKRRLSPRLGRAVTIFEENAAAALEIMSRYAIDPRWLIYLPPTMSPCETSRLADFLEHPLEAFDYYRKKGVDTVICEQKHMGSRAVVVLCRDEEAAAAGFGVTDGTSGLIYTRTGRRFFADHQLADEAVILERLRAALTRNGFWQKFKTGWLCLDAELMPWSAKAQDLLIRQYAPVGRAGRDGLTQAMAALDQAQARSADSPALDQSLDLAALRNNFQERLNNLELYTESYRRYCWPLNSVDDYRLAPFHILATEGLVWNEVDHLQHLAAIRQYMTDDPLFLATEHISVDCRNEESAAAGVAWWQGLTEGGGEGMVVKPSGFIASQGTELLQPAVKCRGREYLRIIYGPEYTTPAHLERLKDRSLNKKRRLALQEFALGMESLERFVKREPLHRVHECVFAVLALESEPVDPRL